MRKKVLVLTLAVIFMVVFSSLVSGEKEEKPRIGVLRFTNHTAAGWWNGSVGQELQDMLAAELVSTGAFQILERKEIDARLPQLDAERAAHRRISVEPRSGGDGGE